MGTTAANLLGCPVYNISRQGSQRVRRDGGTLEVSHCPVGQLPGLRPCAIYPQQCHIGGLGELDITPRRLAQLLAGTGGVEHVVRNLKREPDIFAVSRESFELG